MVLRREARKRGTQTGWLRSVEELLGSDVESELYDDPGESRDIGDRAQAVESDERDS